MPSRQGSVHMNGMDARRPGEMALSGGCWQASARRQSFRRNQAHAV